MVAVPQIGAQVIVVALRRLEIKDQAMLAAITAHLSREADDWLKTVAFAKQQTHLPFIVDGQRDRQMAQLLQLLGLARYKPAGKVMERYVPKMSGFWTEARSAGVWARHRRLARTSPALVIRGRLERAEGAINVIADRMEPLPLATSSPKSRDFR